MCLCSFHFAVKWIVDFLSRYSWTTILQSWSRYPSKRHNQNHGSLCALVYSLCLTTFSSGSPSFLLFFAVYKSFLFSFFVPPTHYSPFRVSVICCFAGIIALLLLPSLAKNTYLSENALIPGILPFSLFLFTATLLMHTRCCFWRVCLSGGRTPRSLQTAYCRYFIIKCIVLFSACFVEYKSSDEATYQYC